MKLTEIVKTELKSRKEKLRTLVLETAIGMPLCALEAIRWGDMTYIPAMNKLGRLNKEPVYIKTRNY